MKAGESAACCYRMRYLGTTKVIQTWTPLEEGDVFTLGGNDIFQVTRKFLEADSGYLLEVKPFYLRVRAATIVSEV